MIDAVDELIAYRKTFGRLSPMLRRVHRFHKANPQVLDFLVSEMRVDKENGWTRTSLGSLWHYARWVLARKHRAPGESFVISNNLFPHFGRIIAILHPELNGFFEMAKSKADADLGTMLEPTPKNQKPAYIRRLLWAECLGTVPGSPELVKVRCEMEIERGWRPTVKHEPKSVSRRERVRRAG
jgi:hypothetical protein